MDFWNAFASLFSNFGNLTWQMVVMWGIGALLIYLAIAKKMEPSRATPSAPSRLCLSPECPTSCSPCCSSSASVR